MLHKMIFFNESFDRYTCVADKWFLVLGGVIGKDMALLSLFLDSFSAQVTDSIFMGLFYVVVNN